MYGPLEENLYDPASKQIWSDYLSTLRKLGRSHASEGWESFENDIAEHAAAAFAEFEGEEVERLRLALAQIGPPDKVAEAFVMEASPYTPTAFEILARRVYEIFSILLTSISVVVVLIALSMSVANIFNPDVGVWIHEDGSWSLSFEAHPDSKQLFRHSFILWAVFIAAAFAVLIFSVRPKRREGLGS